MGVVTWTGQVNDDNTVARDALERLRNGAGALLASQTEGASTQNPLLDGGRSAGFDELARSAYVLDMLMDELWAAFWAVPEPEGELVARDALARLAAGAGDIAAAKHPRQR